MLRRPGAAPHPMLRLLAPADFRTMPWKNGGGRTMEIVAYPPGAAPDAFDWRVSIADVDRDGPFSPFPGVERTIVLLDGAGMRLRENARETAVTVPHAPHAFSGDEAVACALVDGPVRDFNAMFRRSRARGSVAVVRAGGGQVALARFRLVYAAAGAQECRCAGHGPIRLEPGHALLVDAADAAQAPSLSVRPLAPESVALVVGVDLR